MYKIAISGKANTGKNTLSRLLVKQLRKTQAQLLTVKYMAFADPIKEMIEIMFPELPKKFLYGPSKRRAEIIPGAFKDGKPLTVRQLLLDLGTASGRGYKDSVWLDNFDFRFKKFQYRDIVLVTDVRFRNEFEHLKQKGFYQIRLYRDTEEAPVNHISESSQATINDNEFDCVIHNDKTLYDLKNEVMKVVNIISS